MINILKLRYQSLYTNAERDIREELKNLLNGIDRALSALADQAPLNEYLLTNAGHVTASIAKRNALLELKPMIEEEEEEEEEK